MGSQFRDQPLGKRFTMVLKQPAEGTAQRILLAGQDWAAILPAPKIQIPGRSLCGAGLLT